MNNRVIALVCLATRLVCLVTAAPSGRPPAQLCPAVGTANIPHPVECYLYYSCVDGVVSGVPSACDVGWRFDAAEGRCKPASPGSSECRRPADSVAAPAVQDATTPATATTVPTTPAPAGKSVRVEGEVAGHAGSRDASAADETVKALADADLIQKTVQSAGELNRKAPSEADPSEAKLSAASPSESVVPSEDALSERIAIAGAEAEVEDKSYVSDDSHAGHSDESESDTSEPQSETSEERMEAESNSSDDYYEDSSESKSDTSERGLKPSRNRNAPESDESSESSNKSESEPSEERNASESEPSEERNASESEPSEERNLSKADPTEESRSEEPIEERNAPESERLARADEPVADPSENRDAPESEPVRPESDVVEARRAPATDASRAEAVETQLAAPGDLHGGAACPAQGMTSDVAFVAHPDGCGKYRRCYDGRYEEGGCRPGDHFNPVSRRCEAAEVAGCKIEAPQQ